MTGVRLEIDVNDGGLGDMMRRASAQMDDLTAPLTASGDLLVDSFSDRFDTETGPGGIPWKPSQPALGLAPRANGRIQPGKTLTDTGALRESMTKLVTSKEVEVGVAAVAGGGVARKAAALQFGIAGINLVGRPFVGFDNQNVADLEDLWTRVMRSAFDEH